MYGESWYFLWAFLSPAASRLVFARLDSVARLKLQRDAWTETQLPTTGVAGDRTGMDSLASYAYIHWLHVAWHG